MAYGHEVGCNHPGSPCQCSGSGIGQEPNTIHGLGKDWDHVSMADYQSDMKESSTHAANIIIEQRKEIEGLQQLVWSLVEAAGGSLMVTQEIAQASRRGILQSADRPDVNGVLYTSRRVAR